MLSNVYFLVNNLLFIVISLVSILISVLTIFLIRENRMLHTMNNLLLCNTCLAIFVYSIMNIIQCINGFQELFFCSFVGYFYNIGIASICYSKAIHSISRLFSTKLTKYRYLLTNRTHQILILLNWLIALLICLPPFFIRNGYLFENESRYCLVSSKFFGPALYITIVSCLCPFHIIGIVYLFIVHHVYRSTRRIWTINSKDCSHPNHHLKREMKIMKRMLIETSSLLLGGPMFLFLIIWNGTQKVSLPPQIFYCLSVNLITIAVFLITIVQFLLSKEIQQSAMEYFFHR